MQVGEKVDARDLRMGAWFEAQVVKLTREVPSVSTDDPGSSSTPEPIVFYHIRYDE